MDERPERSSDGHAQKIADMAAAKAVKEIFWQLGVDVTSLQSISDFREDMAFARSLRLMRKTASRAFFERLVSAIVGAGVTAGALLWQQWTGRH